MRKYLCDNCGVEVDQADDLVNVEVTDLLDNDDVIEKLGDFCDDCLATLKTIIKEGFSKGRA